MTLAISIIGKFLDIFDQQFSNTFGTLHARSSYVHVLKESYEIIQKLN